MGKIIEINDCGRCNELHKQDDTHSWCYLLGRYINVDCKIPNDCPLPDAPAPDQSPSVYGPVGDDPYDIKKPPDYKVFNAQEIIDAAKAFRERVDALRGELNAVHGWRVEVEKQLDELYKRMAKLERRKK